MTRLLRRLLPVLLVLVTVVAVGEFTARPGVAAADRTALAGRFGFRQLPANGVPAGARTERAVAPALEKIRTWISATGAAVALTDLRGLGRPADMCLVDPRDDSVTVAAVPGSGSADYPRVRLVPGGGLPYDATMAPMGCVPADLNEDGAMDFLVYYWGRSPVMFLNQGQHGGAPAAADFRAAEVVTPMQVWNTGAVGIGDLDGSGHLSIVVGNYFRDGARVLDPAATTDARMQMQDGMGMARNAGTSRILQLHPTGSPGAAPAITDASGALPVDAADSWTLAVGLQDLTGSGLPSVYLANDFGPDQLLVNCSTPGHLCLREAKGDRTWTQPKSKVLGRDSFKGMGVAFSYPTGSGLPTILVSNLAVSGGLMESNFAFVPTGTAADVAAGKVPFRDDSEELGLSRSGWSWDVKAGDFDNSGSDQVVQAEGFVDGTDARWPEFGELTMANPELMPDPATWPTLRGDQQLGGSERNTFYAPTGSGRYVDLAGDLSFGQSSVSRGFALGDVNGDGLLDAVVANQWGNSTVLLNTAPGAHPGADLHVVRAVAGGATVPAMGVEVTAAAQHGLPAQKAQLYYANGHAGVSAADVHLAVAAGTPTAVHLTWRDGDGIHSADASVGPGHHTVELDGDAVVVR